MTRHGAAVGVTVGFKLVSTSGCRAAQPLLTRLTHLVQHNIFLFDLLSRQNQKL